RTPLPRETKKAYWWNTPRSRGFIRTWGWAMAGMGWTWDMEDWTRRSIAIRETPGSGKQAYPGHAAKVRLPASSELTPSIKRTSARPTRSRAGWAGCWLLPLQQPHVGGLRAFRP